MRNVYTLGFYLVRSLFIAIPGAIGAFLGGKLIALDDRNPIYALPIVCAVLIHLGLGTLLAHWAVSASPLPQRFALTTIRMVTLTYYAGAILAAGSILSFHSSH